MNALQQTTATAEIQTALTLLSKWAAAEEFWYPISGHPGLGCYGTGYNAWGVQTNQKFLSAMAVLGTLGPQYGLDAAVCDKALERALAAFRFSLFSHVTGPGTCTDSTSWGRTWVSSLGVERMMHAIPWLEPHLTDPDRDGLRAMLLSECEAIKDGAATFGRPTGVVGDIWNRSGKNVPESNLWNGAVLWRTAAMYPDHPRVEEFREEAHLLLINSISVAADETDERIVAGKSIAERFRGANFFPNFALDHHGYMNVGYQVICLSNMAMLHFDMKALDLPNPESLYHHGDDLWQVVRQMVFGDGHLCRIGGDTRVRYTYCQEYLLPTLTLAADKFGEAFAQKLIRGQLEWIGTEQEFNGNGTFYGKRLQHVRSISPYYITRLESDRACVLGMLATHLHNCPEMFDSQDADDACEVSLAGGWSEPEHGDVLHRCPTRIASFAWRANGLAQGLCLPPDDGLLADWLYNLGGRVCPAGDCGKRNLLPPHIAEFDGGFVTAGGVVEGIDVIMAEGWRHSELATNRLAVAALPDGHTMLGLQLCRATDCRIAITSAKSLHLNLPNDLFNDFRLELTTATGKEVFEAPATEDVSTVSLESTWANLNGRIAAVGIYGADSLSVVRHRQRCGGKYHSLYVEELCWSAFEGPAKMVDANATILDAGWATLASADVDATAQFADRVSAWECGEADVRGVQVVGLDGKGYLFLANFGEPDKEVLVGDNWKDLLDGAARTKVLLPTGTAKLMVREETT